MNFLFSGFRVKGMFVLLFAQLACLANAQTWSEKDEIIPNPLPKNSKFGHQIEIDVDMMVVADFTAHSTDSSLTQVGYVYSYGYDWKLEKWVFSQRIASPDPSSSQSFGRGISFHDSTLVVGTSSKHTYAYRLMTNGQFKLTQKLSSIAHYTRSSSSKWSFYSISFTDDFLAICAGGYSDFKPNVPRVEFGAVMLFKKDQQKQEWVAHDTITATDTLNLVNFGSEALFYDDLLLVSCIEDPKDEKGKVTNEKEAGSVYVFKQNSSGKWTQIQKIKALDFKEEYLFGYSLCEADNYVLVSAPLHSREVNGKTFEGVGAVYSYKKASSGDTLVLDTVLFPDNSYWDWFGTDLAYENGYLAVGLPYQSVRNWTQNTSYSGAGSVLVYKMDSGKWKLTDEVKNPEPLKKDFELMGRTVAWHGTELVTYRWRTFSSYTTYAVNVFDICDPSPTKVHDTICNGDTNSHRSTFYSIGGQYKDTLTFKSGCNSIHEINVFAHPSYNDITDTSLCSASALMFQGSTYSNPGTYLVKYNTVKGCDSSFTLNLADYPSPADTVKTSICEGESVSFNGSTFWPSNDTLLADTLPSQYGCDSFANLAVSVAQPRNVQIGYPTGLDESDSVLQFIGVYDSLHWMGCGTNEILHKNSSTFTTDQRDSFFATYYINGCSNSTGCLSLNKWPISIDEINQLELSCGYCEVWIYDVLGRPLARSSADQYSSVIQPLRGSLVVMVIDAEKNRRRVFRVYR